MHTLTPEQIRTSMSPAVIYILFACAAFSFSVLCMVILSGFSLRKAIKHKHFMGAALVIALILPILIINMYEQASVNVKADQKIDVQYLKTQRFDRTTTLVSFSTSVSALVYAEYTDYSTHSTYPVFQENKTDNKVLHVFVIRNMKVEGGSLVFIINGTRYLYQGKPLRI